MKIMYKGQEIEIEDPDKDEQSLDILTPISIPEEQEELQDTMELTEEQLKEIRNTAGDINEQ